MIFTSFWFVVFAAAFFPAYWMIRAPGWRKAVLLAGSVLFHTHFAGPAGILPVYIVGVAVYAAGLSRRRLALDAGIVLAVLSLIFYKYTTFLSQSLIAMVSVDAAYQFDQLAAPLIPGYPPLAISFFTFEFVHYLYDVRRGERPIRSPVDFALFTLFFPSLVAGPIKRYEQFLPALHDGIRKVAAYDVKVGVMRVACGFFKKVVLADNLTRFIEALDPQYESLPWSLRWQFFLALGLRILWDFSGYSDIAIGLARMAGIRLPENFRWPYLATSIQDFWHRWHISLSSWIRDYIYIPLGGNRHGLTRKIANGMLAFALCGLWHGPEWHFVLWGLYHGAGLAVAANYRALLGARGEGLAGFFQRHTMLSTLLTNAYVFAGWLLFFYPVDRAFRMLVLLFIP